MSKPFQPVSVPEFERMSKTEREKYIDALIEHLQALRRVPLPGPGKTAAGKNPA